jgi:nicotinamide mononucleotide (NMN) deamidase PncC
MSYKLADLTPADQAMIDAIAANAEQNSAFSLGVIAGAQGAQQTSPLVGSVMIGGMEIKKIYLVGAAIIFGVMMLSNN